jgi:hypothetical protein
MASWNKVHVWLNDAVIICKVSHDGLSIGHKKVDVECDYVVPDRD